MTTSIQTVDFSHLYFSCFDYVPYCAVNCIELLLNFTFEMGFAILIHMTVILGIYVFDVSYRSEPDTLNAGNYNYFMVKKMWTKL